VTYDPTNLHHILGTNGDDTIDRSGANADEVKYTLAEKG
jgi:hypothetical protein